MRNLHPTPPWNYTNTAWRSLLAATLRIKARLLRGPNNIPAVQIRLTNVLEPSYHFTTMDSCELEHEVRRTFRTFDWKLCFLAMEVTVPLPLEPSYQLLPNYSILWRVLSESGLGLTMKENVIGLLEERRVELIISASTNEKDARAFLRKDFRSISILLAIVLDIFIVAFLVVIVFVPIKLTAVGPLSGDNRTLYVTSVTVLATVCTTFFMHCIRDLWLQKVDIKLRSGTVLPTLDPIWRNIIGLSSFTERFKQWEITIVLAVSGLVTAAIVGAMVPTSTSHIESYKYYLVDDGGYVCAGINPSVPSAWMWELPNGSTYSVWPYMQFCPTAEALTLLGAINIFDPDSYGYADEGTAVRRTAIGAAASIYSQQTAFDWDAHMDDNSLSRALKLYGSSLLSTTQCTPVMTSNPIQCNTVQATYLEGTLTVHGYSNCSLVTNVINTGNSAGILCTHGSLGQATVVIGTIYPMSMFLAESIGDLKWLRYAEGATSSTLDGTAYGVTCTVDTREAFKYQNVTFKLQVNNESIGTYSRYVDAMSSEACTQDLFSNNNKDPLQHKIPAVAAVAAVQVLYTDLISTTRQFIVQPMSPIYEDHSVYVRTAPFAFGNSRNALEDVLGLNAALVVSRLPMTGGSGSSSAVGTVVVQNTRIGTGKKWALVYTLPLLLVLTTLLRLSFTIGGAPEKSISNRLQALATHFRGD
jgi:hypothetical protein